MSLYSEQDLYKFLERQAIALEKIANSPVMGNLAANSTIMPPPAKAHKAPAIKPDSVDSTPEKPLKVQ